MQLAEDHIPAEHHRITSYSENSVTIPPNTYHHSILVSAHFLRSPWLVRSWDDFSAEIIQEILNQKPEIILFGTGKTQIFPPENLLNVFYEKGIGVECMNNAAACRTYLTLLGDERKILLGLMLS